MIKILDSSNTSQKAFTLIEVLVATAILAMASIGIYYVILSSFDINRKITAETDMMLSISIAMDSMDRDVSQIFSPILGKTTPPVDNTPAEFWSAPQRKDGLRRSRFVGTREKISFISNSNRRLLMDAKESTLQRVIYEIEQDKDGKYRIMKSVDFNVFDYEQQLKSVNDLKKFPIIENLRNASFQFYRADKEQWETSWDSEARFATDESRFPSLVAIEFEVIDPDNEKNVRKWRSEFAPILSLNKAVPKPGTGGIVR